MGILLEQMFYKGCPMDFKLRSEYTMKGDQEQAVDKICRGIAAGDRAQVLLGVTGSGKTFTMANIIEKINRPALVIAHNKTLAAQLCGEFRDFFPENAVRYFVSFYDYYQPEAYVPSKDVYIEKESDINEEIDRMRHEATASLVERRDVIIVASVSCIYGLGMPEEYMKQTIVIRQGMTLDRDWFAPLRTALGRFAPLSIVAPTIYGQLCWTLHGQDRWKFWRQSRSLQATAQELAKGNTQ